MVSISHPICVAITSAAALLVSRTIELHLRPSSPPVHLHFLPHPIHLPVHRLPPSQVPIPTPIVTSAPVVPSKELSSPSRVQNQNQHSRLPLLPTFCDFLTPNSARFSTPPSSTNRKRKAYNELKPTQKRERRKRLKERIEALEAEVGCPVSAAISPPSVPPSDLIHLSTCDRERIRSVSSLSIPSNRIVPAPLHVLLGLSNRIITKLF